MFGAGSDGPLSDCWIFNLENRIWREINPDKLDADGITVKGSVFVNSHSTTATSFNLDLPIFKFLEVAVVASELKSAEPLNAIPSA